MSQEINNSEYRKKALKNLIGMLHDGKSVDEVKELFRRDFALVDASEIAAAEQALIAEGMPATEIQRLCDVHAAIFEGSVAQIHSQPAKELTHPITVMKAENRALDALSTRALATIEEGDAKKAGELAAQLEQLLEVDKHYLKKENLIFPYLERNGITGPPKVMWGVDDEIRRALKDALQLLKAKPLLAKSAYEAAQVAVTKLRDMISKEENILFPMTEQALSKEDFDKIAEELPGLGYCLISGPAYVGEVSADYGFVPRDVDNKPTSTDAQLSDGMIHLPTGALTAKELSALFNTLPVDITFVDANNEVRYFSEGGSRIFPRTKAVIGRNVTACHPPASVHVVEDIVNDLRSGKKSHEDFWLNVRGKFILIRYFAVRDENGEYLGALEVTQDIGPLKEITGEKRLVQD